MRAPTGAGEVDPTGGGFLVQVDFAASIFMLAHDMGEILSRVNKIPISANSNGLKIPGVDETSRATGSRWGGVAVELGRPKASPATATKPKFRLVEFDLKKLISLMYHHGRASAGLDRADLDRGAGVLRRNHVHDRGRDLSKAPAPASRWAS